VVNKELTYVAFVAPAGQAYTGPLDVRQSKRTHRIVCGSHYGQRGVAVLLEDDESMGYRLQTL